MSSSTSSSDRGPPRALLLAASVVLAVEIVLAVATPRDRGRHIPDEILTALAERQPHSPAVLWGDSVTCNTIDAASAAPWLRDISSTQAISVAGVFYTYERLIATAGAPEVLAVVIIPESLGNDLDQVFTPTYFESCFLRPGEMTDFLRTTGRYAQWSRMLAQAWLRPPSSQRQAGVRQALNRLRGLAPAPRRRLRRTDGLAADTRAGLAKRAAQRHHRTSEISRLYFEKLARRTAADGTRLVLMTGALPRSVATRWSGSGYLAQYERALHDIADGYANVTVEPPGQFADYPDEAFYDPSHLMPDLRNAYGARVAARVRALLDEAH